LVGGVVGGLLGTALASRGQDELTEGSGPAEGDRPVPEPLSRPRRRPRLTAAESSDARMETARQGLEDKIAQLNDAIDDVRRQLGSRNGRPVAEAREKPLAADEG
jgi:hypothetical protein